MECCPFCGGDTYYTKETVSGIVTLRIRFDGEEAENGDMYNAISHKLKSKYAWCADCNKRIFKLKEGV